MSSMIKIYPVIAICSLVFTTTTATIASASQTTWDTTATEYRGRLEQDFKYSCPSNGRVTKVWGTEIYTDDSSICSAAVHAGLITAKQGGNVTIRIKPGQSSYVGTTQKGVSSQDYGSFSGSFIFLNGKISAGSSIPLLKWNVTAVELRGRLEQDFKYRCLPDGRVGSIWGTEIYTDDSSICSAAVHAGLISTKQGGEVTIRIKSGQFSYTGTNRNGVISQDYGSFSGSFIFLNGKISAGSSENMSTIPLLKWNVTAVELRGRLEQDFRYRCLPDGRVGSIWGTDIYTDDSSICSAAVHAGLISTKEGGEVTIRIKPGQFSYTGTNRNGVFSKNYGSFSGSFIFISKRC